MKRIMSRSYLALIVTIAFFAGICLFAFRILTQNQEWVQQAYNGHMSSSNGLAQAGDILDRNGTVLAATDGEGVRRYHDDYTTREALLHVVGDNSLNISTAVQSMYRTELTGYSFIWGLGMPNSLKTKNNVSLTVDADACRAAYQALGSLKGACFVYNYKTGETLCSVSSPSYDPQYPPEITEDNEDDYEGVYLDNVVSATFTPGSTFKIITAAAAIENLPDIYDQTFYCDGSVEVEGSEITCEEAHGELSFEEAFSHSCNVAFAQIALQIGEKNLTAAAEKMGFNQSFEISDIPVVKSHYDVSKAGENELAWSGIGQYEDLANPAHMAMLCGAIASDGKTQSPVILKNDRSLLKKLGISAPTGEQESLVSAPTAGKLRDLMRGAANYYYNYRGVDMAGLDFCAKTGTAEVGEDKEPTAWFVGFTEDEEHPYAFAAVVVEGGYGVSAAASVVRAAVGELVY